MSEQFSLQIRPQWSEMNHVNEAARKFFDGCELAEESVDTFTMVACELMENGIKYGEQSSKSGSSVSLDISIGNRMITVQVFNTITADSQFHLRQLDKTLQWIRGFQDPFQAYVERIKQISKEPSSKGTSGLGIVRIAYEARAAIDFVVSEDDTLAVSAVAKISR